MKFKYFELWDIGTWHESPSVPVLYKGRIPVALAMSPENALSTLSSFAREHEIPVKGCLDVCALKGKPTGDKYIRVHAPGQ